MTRSWMLCASPFALAAGMMLVGCSSSSSNGTNPPADGGKKDTGSASKDSGSAKDGGGSKDSGAVKDSGKGGKEAGSKDAGADVPQIDYAAGDSPDACAPPEGGPTCTPGIVGCGDAGCNVAQGNVCCQSTTAVCQSGDAGCTTQAIGCEEAADCTGEHQICCLNATGESSGTLSCQPGPTCPVGINLASAQICRSNAECASGSCAFYVCNVSPPVTLEVCEGSLQGLLSENCTKM